MKFRAQRCFDLGILHVTDIACRSMDGLTVTTRLYDTFSD